MEIIKGKLFDMTLAYNWEKTFIIREMYCNCLGKHLDAIGEKTYRGIEGDIDHDHYSGKGYRPTKSVKKTSTEAQGLTQTEITFGIGGNSVVDMPKR